MEIGSSPVKALKTESTVSAYNVQKKTKIPLSYHNISNNLI
jgi:hypothetical protein